MYDGYISTVPPTQNINGIRHNCRLADLGEGAEGGMLVRTFFIVISCFFLETVAKKL